MHTEGGKQLNEGRKWFLTTLEHLGEAVVITDTVGRVIFLNSLACAFTGWEAEEAYGRPIDDILHLLDRGERIYPIMEFIEKGRHSAQRLSLLSKDGHLTLVDCQGGPFKDEEGGVLGVMVAMRDVGEQVRMEEQIRHRLVVEERTADIARHFVAQSVDLGSVLKEIAGITASSHVFLFYPQSGKADAPYFWCSDGDVEEPDLGLITDT